MVETRYVQMLIELFDIPWFYNLFASAAHWVLLAGYLVIPGTFTSLQKSDALREGLDKDKASQAILNTIQNPPLAAISCAFFALGAVIMA